MSSAPTFPVHVEGHLDPSLSRWLWLVKWVLVIPHYVVLAFLWTAFVVLSACAFFAILATGRYPRAIFDFNVGVLRWSWRVAFYAFSANGTDRYPPFSLHDADYPASLSVDPPERLSRGLVLVKWWLLAIPQYLIVGIIVGGGWLVGVHGLLGLLVLFGVVALLFTGTYPRSIFDLALGLNRWALRVAAYAGLMTDAYPPFRLDQGEMDPAGPVVRVPAAQAQAARWTAGRVVLVSVGSVLALTSLGALALGAAGVAFDRTQRDAAGFIASDPEPFATATFALVSERVSGGTTADRLVPGDALGTTRVQVASAAPVFVGIARESDLAAYLGDVRRAEVEDVLGPGTRQTGIPGGAPAGPPAAQDIWTASTSGVGPQTLLWEPARGDWRLVVMNADGTPGVRAVVSVGARFPDLGWIAGGVLAGGALLLVLGATLVVIGVSRARRPA
jgi:hypothetical protein